jgi:hypothetical protein
VPECICGGSPKDFKTEKLVEHLLLVSELPVMRSTSTTDAAEEFSVQASRGPGPPLMSHQNCWCDDLFFYLRSQDLVDHVV